ncbi:phosphatase PAP2 family protein [Streptomyces sp. CA-249302]|uniref:phosphatase PAP2 family protein n=1 Tax=Streptomyces sp. CA-249302 TaxID=3240058 RepID=UPI003D92FA16
MRRVLVDGGGPTGPVRRRPPTLVLVCALLFAALATAVGVRHGAPLPGDGAAHAWALRHRPPVAEALARGITATGTGPWPYLIAVTAGLLAGRGAAGRLRAVGCALAVLFAGQLVRGGFMELFARARPDRTDWATHASGFAFPSGHATTSALSAGLLCWAITRHTRPALARTTCALAVCWAAAVGATRVYLGVHWASDVVAGWLLAATWLGLCGWGLAGLLRLGLAGGGALGPGSAGGGEPGSDPVGGGVARSDVMGGGAARFGSAGGCAAGSDPVGGGVARSDVMGGGAARFGSAGGCAAGSDPVGGGVARSDVMGGGAARLDPAAGGEVRPDAAGGGVARSDSPGGGALRPDPPGGGASGPHLPGGDGPWPDVSFGPAPAFGPSTNGAP